MAIKDLPPGIKVGITLWQIDTSIIKAYCEEQDLDLIRDLQQGNG